MSKLITAILILTASNIHAATDYTCVNNCSNQGYMYGYCQNKCSYNSSSNYNTQKQTDYTCVNRCSNAGYMYNYCQSKCSF